MKITGITIDNKREIRLLTQDREFGVLCNLLETCLVRQDNTDLDFFYKKILKNKKVALQDGDLILHYEKNSLFVSNDFDDIKKALPIKRHDILYIIRMIKRLRKDDSIERSIGRMIGRKRSFIHVDKINIHYGWLYTNIRITALNSYSLLFVDFISSSFSFIYEDIGLDNFIEKIYKLENNEAFECGSYFKIIRQDDFLLIFKKGFDIDYYYHWFIFTANIYKISDVKKSMLEIYEKMSELGVFCVV